MSALEGCPNAGQDLLAFCFNRVPKGNRASHSRRPACGWRTIPAARMRHGVQRLQLLGEPWLMLPARR